MVCGKEKKIKTNFKSQKRQSQPCQEEEKTILGREALIPS